MNTSSVCGFFRLLAGPALGVMLLGGLGLLAGWMALIFKPRA